jgi:hypothetical protein
MSLHYLPSSFGYSTLAVDKHVDFMIGGEFSTPQDTNLGQIPFQFTQWTMAFAPKSPMLEAVLAALEEKVRYCCA